jgi:hypothetical protein
MRFEYLSTSLCYIATMSYAYLLDNQAQTSHPKSQMDSASSLDRAQIDAIEHK